MSGTPLVFVTGASSGIGAALAEAYARRGWRLALTARREASIREWAAGRGIEAQHLRTYTADVREAGEMALAADRCLRDQGVPDVVIASAGISVGVDTAEFSDLEVFQDVLRTNLMGMAHTFHPFVEPMRRRRSGTLVGISSMAAVRGLAGHGAYCASKAGVVSYCESLRLECRPFAVRVVTLLPGYVATPLTAGNDYPMPFAMTADAFATQAIAAIGRGDRLRIIPWQMACVARLLRAMPDALYDRLAAGRGRKRRRQAPADSIPE